MDLMQKLSETKVDTSLFRSTKTMGAAKESKREQMRRALLEERFGINMEENSKILYEERKIWGLEELELVELSQTIKGITGGIPGIPNEVGESDQVTIKVPETKTIVGSGLKRPLESDTNGQPIIKKVRKSREVREVRLLDIIETMERQKEQGAGDSSMDEDEDEEEIDSESRKEYSDGEEEEWGGIPDSPISGGGTIVDTPRAVISDEGGSSGDGEDDEDEDEENELVPRLKRGRSEKANAFKKWALVQRRQVMNSGDPSDADTSMPNLLALKPGVVHSYVPRKRGVDMTPPPELLVPAVERKVRLGRN